MIFSKYLAYCHKKASWMAGEISQRVKASYYHAKKGQRKYLVVFCIWFLVDRMFGFDCLASIRVFYGGHNTVFIESLAVET